MNKRILEIFYSRDRNVAEMSMQAIYREYQKILEPEIVGMLELDKNCFSEERNQYDADLLLTKLRKNKNLFLWVVHDDIFSDDLNFVFGCAIPLKGAILSTFRLRSKDLIEKEAIHEIGHVLGLTHCKNECVMMFSNSLYEAIFKPKNLCDSCREKLRKVYGYV